MMYRCCTVVVQVLYKVVQVLYGVVQVLYRCCKGLKVVVQALFGVI